MMYFSINELTRSVIARTMGIDNKPTAEAVRNLTALTENVLDPLRQAWGRPITVNSGYRSAALNKEVGGVPTSMHLSGRAADITAGSTVDNRKLYQLALDLKLPFFELIGRTYGFKWLHISYNPARKQRIEQPYRLEMKI